MSQDQGVVLLDGFIAGIERLLNERSKQRLDHVTRQRDKVHDVLGAADLDAAEALYVALLVARDTYAQVLIDAAEVQE